MRIGDNGQVRAHAAIALFASGCTQLFDFEDPVAAPKVIGHVARAWLENNANGLPVQREDTPDISAISALVETDNDWVQAPLVVDGASFSFEVPVEGARYRLAY